MADFFNRIGRFLALTEGRYGSTGVPGERRQSTKRPGRFGRFCSVACAVIPLSPAMQHGGAIGLKGFATPG